MGQKKIRVGKHILIVRYITLMTVFYTLTLAQAYKFSIYHTVCFKIDTLTLN